MRRILILSILVVLFVSLGYFAWILIQGAGISGIGWLTVRTEPLDLPVRIDGEYVGQTPLDDFQINAGDYVVQVGDNWQQKIIVAPTQKSLIFLTLSQSDILNTGYTVSVEKNSGFIFKNSQIIASSSPSEAEVFVDGKSSGLSPIVLTGQDAGLKKIEFRKEGYEPLLVEASLSEGYKLRVDARLLINPLVGQEVIDIDYLSLEKYTPRGDLKIVSRQEWGGVALNEQQIPVQLTPWSQIQLWGVKSSTGSLQELIYSLDELLRIKDELPALPYAYIINSKGEIYEGLGIFDFDFSALNNSKYTFTSGAAPILILSQADEFVSEQVAQALVDLLKYLEQDPVVTARGLSELVPIVLDGGDVRVLEMKWQNTSSIIWRKEGFNQVVLKVVNNAPSDLYDPETWISPTELAIFERDVVFPGEIASYALKIRAPYYSGNFTEQLCLYDKTREKIIPETEFKLEVQVNGETDKLLMIKDTEMGFLNVRSGPGLNFQLITTIFPGEKMAWIVKEGNWYQIILRDGTKGWVSGTFIEEL